MEIYEQAKKGDYQDEMIDDSEEPQLPYKLSISEYEEIA